MSYPEGWEDDHGHIWVMLGGEFLGWYQCCFRCSTRLTDRKSKKECPARSERVFLDYPRKPGHTGSTT